MQWAARVVARSGPERAADRELRSTMKMASGLTPEETRWISRAVFAYFRWQGWLDGDRPLERRIDQAAGFADTFARKPGFVPDAELMERAVPAWVREAMDVPAEWIRALQAEPRLWLRARPGKGGELAAALGGEPDAVAGPVPDSVEYRGLKDLFRTPSFHKGEFEIQDVASQAVAHCCIAAMPAAEVRWWDVCAGEGGKTLHLADLLAGKGTVMATDRAEWRLDRLQQRLSRARIRGVRWELWDESLPVPGGGEFDGVLVDAPCTGLGTWGRNPHARWTVQPKDVEELVVRQLALLGRAAEAVRPGGRLVYSVCTLTRAETAGAVEAFGKAHADFEPFPFANPFVPDAPASPSHLFWPQVTGGSGMFVAQWRRRES